MKHNRKAFLDILRVVLSLCVIAHHVIGNAISTHQFGASIPENIWSSLSALLLWTVFDFFIITGYIWLGDERSCEFSDIRHHVLRFTATLLTVGYAFAFLERLFISRSITPSLFILSLGDVLSGNLWDHMWYVYICIGVYLFLPVIKPFFHHSSEKKIEILLTILIIFTVIFPALSDLTAYKLPVSFPIVYPAIYLCIGGYFSKMKNRKINTKAAAILLTVSCVLQFTANVYHLQIARLDFLFRFVSSVSLFALVCGSGQERTSPIWLSRIAESTFGIYLLHPLFINILTKVFGTYPLRVYPVCSIAVTIAAVFTASFAATHCMRKIPAVRKYIL